MSEKISNFNENFQKLFKIYSNRYDQKGNPINEFSDMDNGNNHDHGHDMLISSFNTSKQEVCNFNKLQLK